MCGVTCDAFDFLDKAGGGGGRCSRVGRGQPMIFWAVLMTLCIAPLSLAVDPAYKTIRQYVVTHSPQINGRGPAAASTPGCFSLRYGGN